MVTEKFSVLSRGHKEDKAGWSSFPQHLKERGLGGVRLFITDACIGLVESLAKYYPESKWQRCMVHFYRNVFNSVPRKRVKDVAAMLKAIHASEDKAAARLRHIAGTKWGQKRYLNMELLREQDFEQMMEADAG